MLQHLHAGGGRDDGAVRQPHEQSVFDHPGNSGKASGKRRWIRNAFERGVEDQVPPVRDKRMAVAALAGSADHTYLSRER